MLQKPLDRRQIAGVMVLTIILMMAAPMAAFAESDVSAQVTSGVTDGLTKAYDVLKTIATPIALIALVVCGIRMLVGNAKSAEEAKGTIIKIVLAMAVIYLAPLLVRLIISWFNGSGGAVPAE